MARSRWPNKSKECKLKLDKLRILRFLALSRSHDLGKVELETPRLSTIAGYFCELKLNHPETVRILELRYCEKEDDLTALVNLEHLFCEKIDSIEDDFLVKLTNLKTIQFFHSPDEVFRKLHKQKADLQRTILQIQFLGINFDENECPKHNPYSKEIANTHPRYTRNPRDYYWQECKHDVSRFQCLFELGESNFPLYLRNWLRMAAVIPFGTRL